MDNETEDIAQEMFGELMNSFNLMMGAKTGELDTPTEATISTTGKSEAEALGSARLIAEEIEETEHGYSVELDDLGETDGLPDSDDVRFRYKLTVTEARGE